MAISNSNSFWGSIIYGPRGAINVHRGLNISAYFSPPGPNISKYLDQGPKYMDRGVFFRGGQICRHSTISGFTATPVTDCVCKPRPVPFALKEALGKELDRLETAGILEKVSQIGLHQWLLYQRLTVSDYVGITSKPSIPIAQSYELFASLAGGVNSRSTFSCLSTTPVRTSRSA